MAQLADVGLNLVPKAPKQETQIAALKGTLSEACFFAVDERGAVIEVRFDPKANGFAQSLLRSVITTTQFVRAEHGEASWITEEVDTTGHYRASYKREGPGAYTKQKLEYLPRDPGVSTDIPTTRVSSSHAALQLDATGTLVHLRSLEEVDTSASGLPPLHGKTTLSVRAGAAAKALDLNALRKLYGSWVPARPDDAAFIADTGPSRDFDLARINGQTFETMLKNLAKASSRAGDPDKSVQDRTFVGMVSLLRQDERALTLAADHIIKGKGLYSKFLLDALRDAGTPAAQNVFRELLDRVKPADRLAIVQRMSRLARPTPETVARLLGVLGDPALKVQAEFGLGAAAHALHKVDPATAGLATRALLDELDKSKEETDVANTLAALGASGQRELLRVVPRYLHDKSATVRSAAALALRRIPGDQADALLISMLDSEKSVKVRSDVIHAGRQRVPSEKVMARAERIVRADPASEVRLEGLTLIGAWRRAFPRGRATVTWASEHDQDEKVRAAAREQLAMWDDAP